MGQEALGGVAVDRTRSRPVRVLWVSKGLGPGGAERLLVSVAEARDREQVEYEAAYLLPGKQHLVPELAALGVPSHLLAGPRGLLDPRWLPRLRRLAARFDVVHLHSPAVAALARPVLLTLRPRPRIVATEHNIWASFDPPTRVGNWLTSGADDARIAVSEEVQQSMRPRAARRTEVLLHGVPSARLGAARTERARMRAELGFADDEVVVATIANFRPEKDYPNLLQAAIVACDAMPQVRFVAVGQGGIEAEIHALHATLPLGDRFRFLGFVPDPSPVLAACDVFTLASRFEGLPISLIEALTIGLPVAVTDAGGIPAVVTDGQEGFVVPHSDHRALAAAILRLAADPALRARCSDAARVRAADFDIVNAARRIEAIYAEVVTGHRTL